MLKHHVVYLDIADKVKDATYIHTVMMILSDYSYTYNYISPFQFNYISVRMYACLS